MVYAFILAYWIGVTVLAVRAPSFSAFGITFAGALVIFGLWLWAYYQMNYADNRTPEEKKRDAESYYDVIGG